VASATKKFITFVAIALVAIIAIVSSVYVISVNGKGGETSSKAEISVAQINKEIVDKMGYKGISELKSGDISAHFDIPENSVTQASIYIADSNISAMEIACFKLNGQQYEEAVRQSIAEHISAKLKGFQESPKESEYIRNYELDTADGYVFMAIGENADMAGKIFLDMFEEEKK